MAKMARRGRNEVSQGQEGQVRFTTYSHRSVYNPNDPNGASFQEYESFSRGIREERGLNHHHPSTSGERLGRPMQQDMNQRQGRTLVSETHRTYTNSFGYERVGISRTLGEQGRSLMRERWSNGTERTTQKFGGTLQSSQAEAFDNTWQDVAMTHHLDQVPFLKGSSVRQQIRHNTRNERREGRRHEEEREIARRGRDMFNQHTENIIRQAREQQRQQQRQHQQTSRSLGGQQTRTMYRRSANNNNMTHPSQPTTRAPTAMRDDEAALHFARREAERFWS